MTPSRAESFGCLVFPWLLALFLTLPSSNYHVFNGIPWNTIPEFLVVCLAIPVLLSRRVRRAYRATTPWTGVLGRRLVTLAIALGVFGKIALFSFGGYEGFAGLYRSPASPPAAREWEKSFTNPLSRFDATRIDPAIDFQPANWNLSFFNSVRFNFYPWIDGNVSRDRLPVAAEWRGLIDGVAGRRIRVVYVGEGHLEIGKLSFPLEKEYGRLRELVFAIPAGPSPFTLRFLFDDKFHVGDPPPGPYATCRVLWEDADRGGGTAVRVKAVSPWWRGAGLMIDGFALVFVSSIVRFYSAFLRRDVWLLVCVLGLGGLAVAYQLGARRFDSAVSLGLALSSLLFLMSRRVRPRSGLLAYLSIVCLVSLQATLGPADLQTVWYRSAGNDWLSYESFAHTILDTGSMEAGEKIFLNQPLSRYWTFVAHLVFGDGDPPIAIAALVALNTSIFWLFFRFRVREGGGWRRRHLQTLTGALLLFLAASSPVVTLVKLGASEILTWITLFVWFPLLFDSRRVRDWLAGALMLGASAGSRGNQIPALMGASGIFLTSALRIQPLGAMVAGGLALGIVLLPALHNWWYGGKWVWFTGTYALNTLLAPTALLRLGSDAAARATLWAQVKGLFYLSGGSVFGDSLFEKIAFHGLEIVWLVGLVAAAFRFGAVGLRGIALLFLPAAYLAVHVFFYVTIYYPRHIIAPHFMMGVASIYCLREWERKASS